MTLDTATTPPALDWSVDNCQIARTMAILGERATMEVLREVFNGVRRFADMQRHSGVARQVLTNRLAMLVDEGILRREPYQTEGSRARHEYRPTQKGLDLYPVLTAMSDWGTRYVADSEGASVVLAHRGCGAQVHPILTCEEGHQIEEYRDVVPRPGPGATPFGS